MTVGVVGLGLIGGSVGLSLRDPSREIVGYDPSDSNARLALERSCVDRLALLDDVAKSDVVFVAAPPAYVVQVLDQVRASKNQDTVFTDCTSAKRIVAEWGLARGEELFVPGHPMAGHEKSGPAFASAWMFRGAHWILSPLPITSASALSKVESLVKAMGATPVRVPADRHDHHVALISHLPHALAALLIILADKLDDKDSAGGSWRDLTRVAGVDPNLWTQIFLANRVELGNVLGEMSNRLAELESQVRNGDDAGVQAFFEAALAAKSRNAPAPASQFKPKSSSKRRRP